MKKEQILENSYNTYFTDSTYNEYPDKNFTEIYVLPAMDDFAKQECLKIIKWVSDNQQDFTANPEMSDKEVEDYYNEIILDLQSKQK